MIRLWRKWRKRADKPGVQPGADAREGPVERFGGPGPGCIQVSPFWVLPRVPPFFFPNAGAGVEGQRAAAES